MKFIFGISIALSIFVFQNSFIFADEIAPEKSAVVGKWQTIDDETKKPRSVVEIVEQESEGKKLLSGRVVEVINPEKPNLVCEKCSGEKKDKPIVGLEILSGFQTKDNLEWTDGEILDPKNGKVYRCRLRLKDDGKKLEVRGFVGISLLGRSQVWVRQ